MDSTHLVTVLIGTVGGLHEVGAAEQTHLAGHEVTALSRTADWWWAGVDGRTISRRDESEWTDVARVEQEETATCLAGSLGGLLVGTTGAHLLRLAGRRLVRVESFEGAPGRAKWYTPWGAPADTRSVTVDPAGTLYVNVHVGGVVRSRDGGQAWQPTVDIDADVHQVLAHPTVPGLVMVASAEGFGLSTDGGDSWVFDATGLHASYLRAVAVAGDTILVSASTGPRGRSAALYRRRLGATDPWIRCRQGLPEWFPGNIDTHCLAAQGPVAAFGTDDGRVFGSTDKGDSWALVSKGLPAVRCVAVG